MIPHSSQSTISFPSSSPAASSGHSYYVRPRTPHLPFRRISLPTTASFQRLSVASVASFDSLPEEGSDFIQPQLKSSRLSASHLAVSTTAEDDVCHRSIETPTKTSCRQRGRHKAKYSSEAACASIARSPSTVRVAREARQHKRSKIIQEFFDTEKSYVDGLDFIYHNFLSPLIASLETSEPLLDRASLTKLFSNFIDIWNLHKAFFDALARHLSPMLTPESTNSPQPPPLSSILLSHFPYLSLYTPFITAFPSILSTLVSLTTPASFSHPNSDYSKPFSDFLVKQEAHPRCGKLKFRDWMLTIVQRCPRYLLLLKDLRGCTEPVDELGSEERGENGKGEYDKLGRVLDLVTKITSSLNASLQTHAQTLSLISLQRSTSNLPHSPPFQFVLPGRILLKRGQLYQIERSEPPREREFLLFSDCLAWLAKKGTAGEETLSEWGRIRSKFMGSSESVSSDAVTTLDSGCLVYGTRNRSMSDAYLPLSSPWRNNNNNNNNNSANGDGSRSTPSSPRRPRFSSTQVHVPIPTPGKLKSKRHSMAGIPSFGNEGCLEERWVYKGRLDLVDLEVVVSSEWGVEQRRFEILSTEGSFALYAATEDDRDDWVDRIRQAKAQWLVSLNVTHPNSTLTSSASTNHIRKSLQALPFPPSASTASSSGGGSDRRKKCVERIGGRSKVDHWVPAIWIPNERTKECMRCGHAFSWRRRRHHCRLCGRCVCAGCSAKTFYITDTHTEGSSSSSKEGASKPARACNVCYETVFPVLDSETHDPSSNSSSPTGAADSSDVHAHKWDTITSLSNFSAWISTPSFSILPGRASETSSSSSSSFSSPLTPKALMGMDFERLSGSKLSSRLGERPFGAVVGRRSGAGAGARGRVRLRSSEKNGNSTRPLSMLEIFQDGGDHEEQQEAPQVSLSLSLSPRPVESTVKRRKRFSHPAIAMQPLNVTARTVAVVVDSNGGVRMGSGAAQGSSSSSSFAVGGSSSSVANGATKGERSRRFSLVSGAPFQMSRLSLGLDDRGNEKEGGDASVGGAGAGEKSVVMDKLSELLNSSKAREGG